MIFVGVLNSERRAGPVDDKVRWSWLRPRFELDEERLKNSQSLRMAKRGDERRAWNGGKGRGRGRRMRRSFYLSSDIKVNIRSRVTGNTFRPGPGVDR